MQQTIGQVIFLAQIFWPTKTTSSLAIFKNPKLKEGKTLANFKDHLLGLLPMDSSLNLLCNDIIILNFC